MSSLRRGARWLAVVMLLSLPLSFAARWCLAHCDAATLAVEVASVTHDGSGSSEADGCSAGQLCQAAVAVWIAAPLSQLGDLPPRACGLTCLPIAWQSREEPPPTPPPIA